jgi:two-component system cell cycle response regulator
MQLASLDPLTGIFNRRAFFERAQKALAQSKTNGGTLAAIMLDIDHFKRVNDVYGHQVGDRAIREVASLVSNKGKIIGRLGGEEFALLLPGCDLAGGKEMAELLRRQIMAVRLPEGDKVVTFTSSFGVSEWQPGESVDDMLRRADMALYAAKAEGRNCVTVASEALAVDDYDGADRPVRGTPRSGEAAAAQSENVAATPRSAA